MTITRGQISNQITKGAKMPKVGKKHYPYTAKGVAMAKASAKIKGKKVSYKKKKKG